jgi:predicted outer membrane repeat protein
MSFFSWLASAVGNRQSAIRSGLRKPKAGSRKPPRFRPRLEALEDRWLPSTLTVLNNLDSGVGSLRADIAAAKSGDTIVFAPNLDGQTITLTSGKLSITTGVSIQGPGADQLTVSDNDTSPLFDVNASQPVVLSGMTITNGMGVAIHNQTALVVSGCTISNSVIGIGNLGTLTMSQCTVSGNNAGGRDGGGISCYAGTVSLTNCTLANNTAYKGGAIFVGLRTTATLTNCTIANNSAAVFGGGICCDGFFTPGAVLHLTYTIVAGNHLLRTWFDHGPDIFGYFVIPQFSLIGDGRGITVLGGGGNIVGGRIGYWKYATVINPLLGPLQYNGGHTKTMALLPGSLAIGHALNSYAPATDQRGVTRLDVAGEMSDIGAFEV